MKRVFTRGRWRGAVGLIAAYGIALQALFAAFALPASAQGNAPGADFAHVFCFGSGNAGGVDSDAPARTSSGKFHCVLCGSTAAGAAVLPDAAGSPPAPIQFVARYFFPLTATPIASASVRAGLARAPPPNV